MRAASILRRSWEEEKSRVHIGGAGLRSDIYMAARRQGAEQGSRGHGGEGALPDRGCHHSRRVQQRVLDYYLYYYYYYNYLL